MRDAEQLYTETIAICGPALSRLVMGYERDREHRRDLLQDIHVELWRSFARFDGRCSLFTWAYRVAHNVGASHIMRQRRDAARLVDLDAIEQEHVAVDGEARAEVECTVSALLEKIYLLKPVDRSVMLLYLEGESAAAIAETTGTTPTNVAVKIHRIKQMLARQLGQRGTHGD